jgi:hypothetical protein
MISYLFPPRVCHPIKEAKTVPEEKTLRIRVLELIKAADFAARLFLPTPSHIFLIYHGDFVR